MCKKRGEEGEREDYFKHFGINLPSRTQNILKIAIMKNWIEVRENLQYQKE